MKYNFFKDTLYSVLLHFFVYNKYRLFNFLCKLWKIYEEAVSSVYFIINTKHCITYLALTQLFPVLVTSRFHIVKYTHYVAFAAFHLGVCHFFSSHGCVHMGQINFVSNIFVRFVFELSGNQFTDHMLQV